MNTKVEDGNYKQPDSESIDATLVVKYLKPNDMPLQRWKDIFPKLQISLGEDAPDRQELSVRGLGAQSYYQFLLDVWKEIPMEILEWADLSISSQCFRLHGGGLSPQIGPCHSHE
jgi:hypothetical protein